jgi:hypothetical protein
MPYDIFENIYKGGVEMPLIPYSAREGRPTGTPAITVDKQARIRLNKPLRRELGCEGRSIKLYLAYDPVNKRIGLAKPDVVRLTDHRPVTFDGQRGYATVTGFLRKFQIPYDKTYRYTYDGKEGDGWWTFRLEGYDAPDDPKNLGKK